MLYEEITAKVLEACFEVSNTLGAVYVESVYENALFVALTHKGIKVARQVPLKVKFRDVIVGDFKADMIVEGKVLLELKAVESLKKDHYAQLLNYLKTTGIEVEMVINFGNPRLEYRRFENRFGPDMTFNEALQELIGE